MKVCKAYDIIETVLFNASNGAWDDRNISMLAWVKATSLGKQKLTLDYLQQISEEMANLKEDESLY